MPDPPASEGELFMFMRLVLRLSLMCIPIFATGCGLLSKCKDYVGHSAMMNEWLGEDLNAFERRANIRAYNTMTRPRNRTEYSYVVADSWIGQERYICRVHLEVDNATGKIMAWSSEGNDCTGYCRTR